MARLELHKDEEEKFLGDLEKILKHFEELRELDAENVPPMAGGAELKNVLREDGETTGSLAPDKVVEQFPEKEKHYLKVPPVFE